MLLTFEKKTSVCVVYQHKTRIYCIFLKGPPDLECIGMKDIVINISWVVDGIEKSVAKNNIWHN